MNHAPHYDAISTIEHFGYSEREAVFLYSVGVYSGYFLRRQFNAFVHRERGAIATHFLRKAKRLGHIREIQCEPGRSLYQMHSRPLYRVLGRGDSQHRRAKSTREVRRSLILLDYILRHLGCGEFMDSKEAQRAILMRLGVSEASLRSANTFREQLPIVAFRTEAGVRVTFPFIDEGQRSPAKFERFLKTHDKLLCTLPDFEVVYVATAPQQFENAGRLFHRSFPPAGTVGAVVTSASTSHDAFRGPRAAFITELITESYPSSLNADPGYDTGHVEYQPYQQSHLFFKEMPNDTG